MMKYNGKGGSVPRETTIAGQRHMLAYINPFELDLLQQYNAAPNMYGPGGVPAYPGNAAAEGGFGLGAGDAFGGGGGSSSGGSSAGSSGASGGGNAGASAGGGNSSGGGEGPGGYDAFGNGYATAAEAAAADAAAEAAAAGANVSASASFGGGYASPATGGGLGSLGGGGVGGYDAFGNTYGTAAAAANADNVAEIGAQLANMGINPSAGTSPGSSGISPSVGFGLTSDPLGRGRADVNPTAPAISPGYSMSMAPPSLDTPALSSAPAVDTSTPAAPAVPGLTESDMFAIDEAVLDALADDTTPSMSSSNVSTNVSPATITEDTATTSTGTTPSSLSLMDQLSMGVIAFGKNRARAADDMFAKGYTAEQIGDFFGRTDATVAANEAAAENAIGARDDVSSSDELAMDLDPCPEGFFLDPVSKVCVIKTVGDTAEGGDGEEETPSWEPVTPEIPMSLPNQTAFSPYTIPGSAGTTALQPYPGVGAGTGGLAATPSPNQAGIIQMAPMSMQPAPPPPPLMATPVRPEPVGMGSTIANAAGRVMSGFPGLRGLPLRNG